MWVFHFISVISPEGLFLIVVLYETPSSWANPKPKNLWYDLCLFLFFHSKSFHHMWVNSLKCCHSWTYQMVLTNVSYICSCLFSNSHHNALSYDFFHDLCSVDQTFRYQPKRTNIPHLPLLHVCSCLVGSLVVWGCDKRQEHMRWDDRLLGGGSSIWGCLVLLTHPRSLRSSYLLLLHRTQKLLHWCCWHSVISNIRSPVPLAVPRSYLKKIILYSQ